MRDKFKVLLTAVSSTLFLVTVCSVSAKSLPENILFVGNSYSYYNNGIHLMTKLLVKAAQQPYQGGNFKLITVSAGRLSTHAKMLPHYLANTNKQWHAMVLQEFSRGVLGEKNTSQFHLALKQLKALADENAIQPYLFVTWGYQQSPQMIKDVFEGYKKASKAYNIPLIPIGLAFDKVNKLYPAINLYDADIKSFSNGKPQYYKVASHPSVAGTYLAACVIYATILQKSPEGIPYTASLSNAHGQLLQSIAWQVVSEYQSSL